MSSSALQKNYELPDAQVRSCLVVQCVCGGVAAAEMLLRLCCL
jgi:hypothetical protein